MHIPSRNASNKEIRNWCVGILGDIEDYAHFFTSVEDGTHPNLHQNRKKILIYLFFLHQDILIWKSEEDLFSLQNLTRTYKSEILNFFEKDSSKIRLDCGLMLDYDYKDMEFLSDFMDFIKKGIYTVFPEEEDTLVYFEIYNSTKSINSKI